MSPRQFQERFVRANEPVIVRRALLDWPAIERWAEPTYLADAFTDKSIPIAVQESGKATFDPMSVKEFWRTAWEGTGERHSYLEWPVLVKEQPAGLSEIAADLRKPGLFPGKELLAAKVFAGWNTRCGMHYHPSSEAILCQVVGKKRVLLFSPKGKQFSYAYPWHWFSEHYGFSRVIFPRDGSWPDTTEFPDLDRAEPVEILLEPGDMLFIPIFWWHVTFGMETSISVAYFWNSSIARRYFTRIGLRSNYMNKFLLKRFATLGPLRDLAMGLYRRLAHAS